MAKLTIDGIEIEAENGTTVIQAAEQAGIEIPRFCYHERLSIAGNCRMCLVEMEKAPKLVASCAMPVNDGMVIHTNSAKVKKAREGVMEFLLINHPLDCPVCDQGGECDLQDQSVAYGGGSNRTTEDRRLVSEKFMGPLIKTTMTRCIHCTRCVRFADEIAGVPELGAIGRGEGMQITTYNEKTFKSEMSGNIVDLCPVGALTSRPYAFKARPWELTSTETIDVHDALGANIRIDVRGREVMRILPRLNDEINSEWIDDKTRHSVDGLTKGRLDRPYARVKNKLVEVSWAEAFDIIAKKLKKTAGSKIAGLVGDLNDAESMYALKKLLTSLGSETIECRSDGAKLDASKRVSYLFNSAIEGVDQTDAVLLIGSDLRREAAVLNSRLRQNSVNRRMKIAYMGPETDLTYRAIPLGDNASVLQDILEGKHDFSKILDKAEKPMLILGRAALSRADGGAILKLSHDIADKYGFILEDWNGFNVLHTAAARVGALDLGLTAPKGIEGIMAGVDKGDIEVVFNLGADETDLSGLSKAFVIYQGSHGDEGVRYADVILPGVAYTEKPGLYVNIEGRVQRAERSIFGPGDAREDWTILRALSDVIGKALEFDTLTELRSSLYAEYPTFADHDELPSERWCDFGASAAISKEGFILPITDFYRTNPIARASSVMAECSGVMNNDEELAANEKRAGSAG
jgi:NADH-quinone oxidoreductase subunit G